VSWRLCLTPCHVMLQVMTQINKELREYQVELMKVWLSVCFLLFG
jgi:hypothetical protein